MPFTQQDLTELEKYYTVNHPEVFQDDSSLVGRSGQQLANLPSNILQSFVNTGEAITNLGIAPSERSAPTSIPKPFDIPEAKTTGQQAVDILLQHLAPELAAALVPYSGVSKLARGAGLGEAATQVAAQGAAGAFTGIKSGPEEAIKQAIVGGGLGGLSVLPRLQRLLPLAGLSAADAGLTYAQTGNGEGALAQGGLAAIFGLLPGAHPTEVPRPEIPLPEIPQRPTGLTGEQPFYSATDLSAIQATPEVELKRAGFPFQPGTPEPTKVLFNDTFRSPPKVPAIEELPNPYSSPPVVPTNYVGAENIVQDQALSKIQIVPEYQRSEGGGVYPPLLHSALGGVIGGALPADNTTQRVEHAAIGAGIGLAAGHALTHETNDIGALFNPAYKLKDGSIVTKEGSSGHFQLDVDPRKIEDIGWTDANGKYLTREEAHQAALTQSPKYKYKEDNRKISTYWDNKLDSSDLPLANDKSNYKGSKIISTALRDPSQSELPPVTGKEWNSPHASLTMDALASGMDDTKLEYGFIDDKGKFLTRAEAEPIAKQAGQIPEGYKSGPKGMQSQDLMGFISAHTAATLAGVGLGGTAGYKESGGDPMGAVSGAIIGGAIGAGLPAIARGLTRNNPHITESPTLRTTGSEIKAGIGEIKNKPLSELAGEEVRGRGETISKASRWFEQYFNVNKPEVIRVAETMAQGSNASALSPVVETHAAFKSSGEKPNAAEKIATSKYIKGQLIPEAEANSIIASGQVGDSPWKVGDTTHMVSPETRAKLVEANDAALTEATSRVPKYGEFIQAGRKSLNVLQEDYASGLPESSRKDQIKNSKDQYITNTFRMFTDPNFKPKSEDIQGVAADVAARRIGENRPFEAYQTQVENMIQEYKGKREGYANRTYSIDPTLMYAKQDLSPAFRQMMGEHTDPEQMLIHSISRLAPSAKQSRLANLLSGLEDESGIPHVLDQKTWDEAIRSVPYNSPEYKKLLAYQDISSGISKGELAGYKASRFAADSLHPVDITNHIGMNKGIQVLTNFFKQSQTNYNPARTARNFVSLPAFSIVSRGLAKLPEASSILNNKGPEYERLLKLGVINNEEVTRRFHRQVNDLLNTKDISGLSKAGRSVHQMASMLHSLPNEMNRVSAFLAAEERFSRQLKLPKDDIAVQNAALKWTDERTINYANIAPGVKIARRIPIFNVFASYASEIGRIAKNVAGDALSGDKHAMVTMAAFALLPIGIVKAAESTMSPADQEQWKKAQALSPDYARARFRAPLGKDAKGNFRNVDFTSLIPSDALNMSARAIANMDWKALAHVNPVSGLEENPVLKTAAETMAGKNFQTQREFRGGGDEVMNAIQNFVPPYTPGIGYQAKKFEHIGEENIKTGRTDTLGGLTGNLVGFNTTTINPAILDKSAIGEVKHAIANERAYLNDTLKMKGTSDEAKQRAVKKYQDAVATILETFRNKSNQ